LKGNAFDNRAIPIDAMETVAKNNLLRGSGFLAGYYFDNPATLFYIYEAPNLLLFQKW